MRAKLIDGPNEGQVLWLNGGQRPIVQVAERLQGPLHFDATRDSTEATIRVFTYERIKTSDRYRFVDPKNL